MVKDLLDHDVPVTVFPEGARSRTGRIQTFKDGFFQFAAENGIFAQPALFFALFFLCCVRRLTSLTLTLTRAFRFGVSTISDIEIIPCALNGSQNGWLPGDWKLDFTTTHITVGAPIKGIRDAVALREAVRMEILRLYQTLPGADPQYHIPHPDDVAFEAKQKAKAEAAAKAAAENKTA